jgi:hypothetical protein
MRSYNQSRQFYCGVALHARSTRLCTLDAGLGSIALMSLLCQEQARASVLASKKPHHPAKARPVSSC